jgi:hypothetical protein
MRLAIVAASSYEENGQVSPIPNAELDVELFGSRLAETDAGFAVHAFPAQRGLADAMEALISGLGERPEALIFYFWGYALQSKEHGPTLLLDGPKLSSFTLARLRRLLAEAADVSLVVLDTTLAEGSTGEPLDAVRAMGRALSNGDSTVSSLISARLPEQRVEQGPPPFTGLLQMILDAQTGSANALTPETLFRAMQSEEVMFADIPAAGCFLGQRDFEVVPAARPLTARPPSVAPPSFPPPPAARPPSFPPPPAARPPSFPPPPAARPPSLQPPGLPSPGFPVPPGTRLPPSILPPEPPSPGLLRPPSVVPPEPPSPGLLRPPSVLPPSPGLLRPPSIPPPGLPSPGLLRPPSIPPPGLPSPGLPPPPVLPPPSIRPSSAPPAALHYEDQDELTAPRAPVGKRSVPPPPPPIRKTAPPSAAPSPALGAAPGTEAAVAPASSAAEHCRWLLAEFERVSDRDGAYRAAECLEALGEADLHEALLAANHRPEGLQAVRGALSYTDWQERLSAGCHDPQTSAVLRALSPALARVGFQHARRLRREPVLSEEARQDPERSTTTLAKTLHWTSRLLCVPAAELYLVPEGMDSLGLVPGPERPLLTCGRALGSGFSLQELVCVWARELSFARPEQAALCYFPNASELSQLLSAALAVGGAIGLRAIDDDAKRLASGLKREVRGAALGALEAAARAYPGREVAPRANAFIRSAELVSGRAALVACGNLALALALDHRFPRRFLTRADERRADLLRFMVSPEFGQIRAALGVAVT